jgi:hypothetical protein
MTDSYKEAYNTSNMTNKSINEAACRLDKDDKITSRIDALIALKEQAMVRSAMSTRAKVLKKLEDFMDNAVPSDSMKIRATELLGKSIGLFKDVIEDNKQVRTPEELKLILAEKLNAILQEDDRETKH